MTISNKHAYFPYVDGLRAIAILSVLLYHLHASWLPGGFSGVDIFFVISGFVVSASVSGLDRCSLRRFIPFFYARRLQRIGPALIVCLLVTSMGAALLIPESWLSSTNQQTGIYAFFGLSNLILAKTRNDYFSPIVEFNPYTHTWSLGVEEQFYFAFPFLFFAWTFAGKWRRLSVGLIAVASVASFGYSAWAGQTDKANAFYAVTSRFWELGAGVLLFQLMSLAGRRFDIPNQPSPRWHTAGAAASFVLIGYSLAASKPEHFPYPGAFPAVLGAMGLLFFLHGKDRTDPLIGVLTSRPVLFIGKISYSLYLWHWPVFVMFRWTVGLEHYRYIFAALLVAFVLAILSYYVVERPVRKWPALNRMPRLAAMVGGLAMVGVCAWVATQINAAQANISVSTVARNANDWYPWGSNTNPAYSGCAIATDKVSVGTSWAETYTREGCASKSVAQHVFAIGDSHAMAYNGMYKEYALKTGASVTVYNNAGCPFLSLQPWREQSDLCKTNAQAALADMLMKIKPGNVVFLPSLRMPRFVDQYVIYPEQQTRDQIFADWAVKAREQAVMDAEKVLQQLHDRGAVVVIEAPKPIFKAPAFRCAEAFNQPNSICKAGASVNRDELIALRKPIMDSLVTITAAVSGVHVWDPFPVLCPLGKRCSEYVDGHPLFFDADHISGYANRLLLPSFEGFVASASGVGAGR